MLRKYLIVSVTLLTFLCNVLPAQAYTNLQTPVAISGTGNLTGVTATFVATIVAQSTSVPGSLVFESPSGRTDSGEAIRISGGTNEIGGRIIIYTDNAGYFTTGHDPRVNSAGNPTGIDGSGLVGQTDAAYTATMFWGMKSAGPVPPAISSEPNTNMDYVFGDPQNPVDGGLGNCVFIVDLAHTHSFVLGAIPHTGLDDVALYKLAGTPVTNTAGDGMYPQAWDYDLYNSATIHTDATRISPALLSSIATLAYSVEPDAQYYTCNVSNLTTYDGVAGSAKSSDYVITKLTRSGTGTQDYFLYVHLAADFTGKPAQIYSTTKLYVAMVKN